MPNVSQEASVKGERADTDQSDSRKNLTSHGIRSLTTALSTLSLNVGPHGHEADTTVAAHLLDCLNTFLKGLRDPSIILQHTDRSYM